jgi:hypothetical protein
MVTTRRVLGIADAGDSTHFGTDDIDFINQLLTATDQSSTAAVDMATTWKFRNTKEQLANPANTFNYIVNTSAITANRNVTYPLLTADDTYLFLNASQPALGFDNFPSISKEGTMDVVGNNTVDLNGILAGGSAGTLASTTSVYDTTEGMTIAYATTAASGVNAGYVAASAGVGLGRRLTNLRMKARSKMDSITTARFYMGFTSLATMLFNDTPLANADHGVIIGFRTTDTNYQVFNNDGSGAMVVTQVAGPIATSTATSFHTFEVKLLASGNALVSIDGTTTTISTRLPTTTTNLFFNCVVQTSAATARTHTIRYIEGEADR